MGAATSLRAIAALPFADVELEGERKIWAPAAAHTVYMEEIIERRAMGLFSPDTSP
jgi:hypothetical protein